MKSTTSLVCCGLEKGGSVCRRGHGEGKGPIPHEAGREGGLTLDEMWCLLTRTISTTLRLSEIGGKIF